MYITSTIATKHFCEKFENKLRSKPKCFDQTNFVKRLVFVFTNIQLSAEPYQSPLPSVLVFTNIQLSAWSYQSPLLSVMVFTNIQLSAGPYQSHLPSVLCTSIHKHPAICWGLLVLSSLCTGIHKHPAICWALLVLSPSVLVFTNIQLSAGTYQSPLHSVLRI